MNIGVIIGMTVLTVGSMVAESIMNGAGKMDEAKYCNLATKCGIGTTALVTFATLIKALRSLG